MIRTLLTTLLLAASLLPAARAAEPAPKVYERGEYKFSVGPTPEFVVPVAVPEQWDPAVGSSDDRWRNWTLDRQLDRRGPVTDDYFDRAFEPMSPALVADAAKYSIDFNPAYQTLTLHRVELRRDGKWLDRLDAERISLARRERGFEDDLADESVTALIVLSDVRPRDVVRIAYSVRGSNPVLSDSIVNVFPIAWVDPILERQGRALYPRGARVASKVHAGDYDVQRNERANDLEVVVRVHGAPAIRDQGNYPSWYSPYPQVEIGPEKRWSDVVAWALPLYPDQVELPAELQARMADWRKLGDKRKQVMALLTSMQEEIRYFGLEINDSTHKPATPATTWLRRYGDCKDKAYLMVSVLRELGMEAEPALVSTELGRSVRDRLPAASVFNHVIVRLRLDGTTYWLDPTLTQQRGELDKLDVADYGVALPVRTGADALVDVKAPGRTDNAVEVVERFVPGADGKAIELFVETRYAGQRAEQMRRRLRSQRREEVAAHYEDYYRKAYGELTVVTPTSLSEDEAANTVLVKEHYRLTPGWDDTGMTSRRLSAYADALRSDVIVPKSLVRTAPIDLSIPVMIKHEVRIELPEGWSLGDSPEDYAIESAPMRYRRTLTHAGRSVTLVHRLDVRKTDVEGAEVGDYLAKVRDIRSALDRHVNLRLPAELGRTERDKRLRQLMDGLLEEEKKK